MDSPARNTSTPPSTHQTDHINLRVTYLHAGNPRPPHDVGALPASLTVSQLKERLQETLPEHPLPHEQRLIYQGRPLMQSHVTLREALRLEGPIGPLPYTLHIIIQAPQPHNPPTVTAPTNPLPPTTQIQHPNLINLQPPATGEQNAQQAAETARRVQEMAQAQFNMLQQHMSMFNHPPPPPHGPGVGQIPQVMQGGLHLNGQPMPVQQFGPPNFFPAPANIPNLQAMMGEHQRQHAQMGMHGAHHHTPMPAPVNGGHIHASESLPTTITERIGPNGERIREVSGGTINVRVDGHHIPNPFTRPSSAPIPPRVSQAQSQPEAQPTMTSSHISNTTDAPPALPPNLPPITRHLPHPFQVRQQIQPLPNTNPVVWLAMSRNGPEALLFAPGHGYFQSSDQPNSSPAVNDPHLAQHAAAVQAAQDAHHAAHVQALMQNGNVFPPPPQYQVGAAANAAPVPMPAQIAVAQAQQRVLQAQNQEQIFGFILQRTWLFVRLYMFMFVLSEPGTWRRWIMLTLSVLICLLPRQNPLNNAFTVIRRHVDNLIGPPHPQPQDRVHAQAENRPQAPAEQPTRHRERGTVQTTPEETAARLIREHRERHPSLIRDTFYRIEQGVALFLASLIPGIGERHVQAREEARAAQRRREEEDARAAAEAETNTEIAESQQSPNSPLAASSVDVPATEMNGNVQKTNTTNIAASSAVEGETGAGSENLRSRNVAERTTAE